MRVTVGIGVANKRLESASRPRCKNARAARPGLRGPGLRGPDYASRYEHVGFGDQSEAEPLLTRALEEFHMPRRKTQRN
jgi:hypothetical protein